MHLLNRVQAFFFVIIIHIVLPIILLITLSLSGRGSLHEKIIYMLVVGNLLFLLFRVGVWEFTIYYLRYFYIALLIFIGLINFFIMPNRAYETSISNLATDFLLILILLFSIYLNINVLRASIKPKTYINLRFPFRNGKYIISEGGNGEFSFLVNYHYKASIHSAGQVNNSMKYGTDIVKINRIGCCVKNILIASNEQYEIYGESVYSPCNATVIEIVNNIENNIPFSRKYPYNVGNCIVLKKDDFYIIMGHLEKNSIKVEIGDQVQTNQLLASTGNCGFTNRPHLHMHVSRCDDGLYWGGEGIPIIFNDTINPLKNKLIIT